MSSMSSVVASFGDAVVAGFRPPVTASLQPRVTFSKDVAPIVFEHCASCHRPGAIAPFSLLTYKDARPRAPALARATASRTMPPWKPEPGYGAFIGAHRLTDSQIEIFRRWADDGAPEGRPADLPSAPTFAEGWRLGTPDLVVTLDKPYTLAGGGPDALRSFIIPIPLSADRYVSGVEFHPGNPRVVHHANLRLDPAHAGRALDEQDPAPGFDGRLTAGDFPDGHFLGWTPGQLPPKLADGLAWRLASTSDLVVQLHMHPIDTPQQVQPSVGFFFTKTPPRRAPLMLRLGRQNIDIPPGDATYRIEDRYVLPVDVDVVAVQPHAHFRAREIKGYASRPDGTRTWLIYIKDWDFNWQDVYRYVKPPALPKGTTVVMEYTYDNSPSNRRNPDRPPARVRWGQNSTDEMGDLWLQVLTRTDADRRRLHDDFGPKVMAEDAIGYETLLAREPDNARLHEAAAELYLSLNDAARAMDHLTRALRIDPRSVEAHYNLATELVRERRLDEAIGHFNQALEIDPSHVGAHVNLGVALRREDRGADAAAHLQRALELDPANAAAHTNLASVLAATGEAGEAIAHYRRALETRPDLLEAMSELAWLLATAPDAALRRPAEAVRLAERAAHVSGGQNARVMEVLAAARAAAAKIP